jgi:purine-nucleoside phosphorylase
VLGFEMEASALFYLAARAGVQAACALTVSDLLTEEITSEESYVPAERLADAVDRMVDVVLEGAFAAGG